VTERARLTVSVVVPLFNGRDLIETCLESIPDHADVVVVDDGSTDGAPELVEARFPRVRVLRNDRNVGFGTTANRGLAACTGAVRVVLNSDTRLRDGALDVLSSAFQDEDVGVAGARRVFPDGSHQTSAARFPRPSTIVTGSFLLNEVYRRVRPNRRFRYELGLTRADHQLDQDVDWVMGTCIALSARCYDVLGGFDEGYYLYAEETDLCWRAWNAGFRVRYVSGAVVEHIGGGSTGDPAIHATRMLRSEARFMATAYGTRSLWRWRLARGVGALLKVALLAPVAAIDRRARVRLVWQWTALRTVLGRTHVQDPTVADEN
jgi:GT2 family glycosyltransferase